MDDEEYDEVQQAADAARLTVSAWVRQMLRIARTPDFGSGTAVYAAPHPPSPPRPRSEPGAPIRVPDPETLRRVMARHGLSSPEEALAFALRKAAEPALEREDLMSLRGTGWSGDLDRLRTGRSEPRPGSGEDERG